MSCETCTFFREIPQTRLTADEKYEADKRPEATGFVNKFKWFWDPSQFRQPEPDNLDRLFDDLILLKRERGYGTCQRFPEAVNHYGDFVCGEYSCV
jgi:hypothetical protein